MTKFTSSLDSDRKPAASLQPPQVGAQLYTPLLQVPRYLPGRRLRGQPARMILHLNNQREPLPAHTPSPQSPPHAQGHPQGDSPAPPGCDAASCAATSGPPHKHPAAPRGRREGYGEPRVPVIPAEQYLSPRSPQPRSSPSGAAKHRRSQLGRTPTPHCLCAQFLRFTALRHIRRSGKHYEQPITSRFLTEGRAQ